MDLVAISATINRLISLHGRTVTLQQLDGLAADYSKPWKGPSEPAVSGSLICKGVFVPAQGESFGREFVSDDLLNRCDEVLLVGPQSQPLESVQQVVDRGLVWKINWIHTLQPGETILVYAFGVSR